MQSYEPEGEFIDEDTKRTTKGRWVDKKGRSHKFSVSTHTGDEGHVASIVKSQYPAKRVVITGQSAEKKKKVAAAKKKKKLEEGEIADKLRKVVADMKAADRKAGLLPGGKDVVDLDVERERRRKKKVDEEVGISSSAAMEKARKEAKLKAKEDEAVKKAQKIKEDRALDVVRANIIKKHGEGAIYDPKRDKPTEAQKKAAAAERQKRQAEKNKAFADRAKKAGYKSTQDYANVVARYGSEENMKKGKGLGS